MAVQISKRHSQNRMDSVPDIDAVRMKPLTHEEPSQTRLRYERRPLGVNHTRFEVTLSRVQLDASNKRVSYEGKTSPHYDTARCLVSAIALTGNASLNEA